MSPELSAESMNVLRKDDGCIVKWVRQDARFFHDNGNDTDHKDISLENGLDQPLDGARIVKVGNIFYSSGGAGTLGIKENNPNRPESNRMLKEMAEEAGVDLRTKSDLVNPRKNLKEPESKPQTQ